MRNPNLIVFTLVFILFSFLLAGCFQQHSEKLYCEDLPYNSPIELASGEMNEFQEIIGDIFEPNDVLTLRQVLALTLMHNPELKVFSLESRAAQARELQAGLWPNPELEIETENVGGTGELRGFDSAETTIQLSQLIELGNKSQKRKKVASLEKEMTDLEYLSKKREIFSEAAKAFISVLKAQEKVNLSDKVLKLSQESFETVEKRVNAGKDSPVEKSRASVALANVKILHEQALRNFKYAREDLVSFWGQDDSIFDRAEGDLDDVEQLPAFEKLLDSLEASPEFAQTKVEIYKNKALLDLEKAKSIGDVSIGAGIQRFNETEDNAFVFGISIPLPIHDRNQGAKQEAAYNLAKSREQTKVAWLDLRKRLNQIYQELANSYNQVLSLKNEVLPASIDMFEAANRAYQEGKIDYLNLLDAQRTLFEIKNQYIDSLADYHAAKIEIERFTGNINLIESEE